MFTFTEPHEPAEKGPRNRQKSAASRQACRISGTPPRQHQGSAKAARLEGTETLIVPRLEYQSLRLLSGELAAPCSPQGALSVATQRYLHQYGLLDPESALDEGPILDISALKKLPKLL